MDMRSVLVGLSAAAVIAPSALAAAEHDPRVGLWIERQAGPSYQGLHRSFEDIGGGLIRVNINLDPQGQAIWFVELACDGRARPVQSRHGPAPAETLACRPVDGRTVEFTFTRAAASGWVTSAGREQVSPDGSVMTVSAVQTDAKGAVTARIERVFDRQP